jgi:hypothetical protein
MSRETTEARHAASQAAGKWTAHLSGCARCSTAARRGQWHELCQEGQPIRLAKNSADRALKENRELDRQPAPGQQAMF